jgi:hypothetical protein
MKAEKERNHVMKFRLSDGEKNYIETKYKASEKKSLSEYLRCQAIFGNVFLIDDTHFTQMKRQLSGACNNINQIAHIANSTQNISQRETSEVRELKQIIQNVFESVEELRDLVKGQLWQ